MMQKLRALRYGIGRAFFRLRTQPRRTLVLIGAIAAAFALFGAAKLTASTVSRAASQLGGAHMIVYLEGSVTGERALAIRDILNNLPAVEAATYIAPQEALDHLRKSLATRGHASGKLPGQKDDIADFMDGLDPGIAPASIEVVLRPGVRDIAHVHPLVERLNATPGVEEVEITGQWLERVSRMTVGLHYAGVCFLIFSALIGGYLVVSVLRLRLGEHRRDLVILDLLGASASFKRMPVMIEGAALGASGAALALLGLWAVYHLTAGSIGAALSTLLGVEVVPAFLPLAESALLIGIGTLLGAAASWLAEGEYAPV